MLGHIGQSGRETKRALLHALGEHPRHAAHLRCSGVSVLIANRMDPQVTVSHKKRHIGRIALPVYLLPVFAE